MRAATEAVGRAARPTRPAAGRARSRSRGAGTSRWRARGRRGARARSGSTARSAACRGRVADVSSLTVCRGGTSRSIPAASVRDRLVLADGASRGARSRRPPRRRRRRRRGRHSDRRDRGDARAARAIRAPPCSRAAPARTPPGRGSRAGAEPERPREHQPDPEAELRPPPHRVAERPGEQWRRRVRRRPRARSRRTCRARSAPPRARSQRSRNAPTSATTPSAARIAIAEPTSPPLGRDAALPSRRRQGADVVLAVSTRSCRHVQPPRRDADRAHDRVPADGRAERGAAVLDRVDDHREVAGVVLDLVDRRAPSSRPRPRPPRRAAHGQTRRAARACASVAGVPARARRRRSSAPSARPPRPTPRTHRGRRGVHQVRLRRRSSRRATVERQQPVIAAGERPAEEDQQQEREQAGGGVPDVVEGLGRQRLAHQRDADRGRRTSATSPPRRRASTTQPMIASVLTTPIVSCDARDAAEARRQRDQPVEHRARAVHDLPVDDEPGLRVLADERRVRGQHVPAARRDDAVVAGRHPARVRRRRPSR